MASPSPFLITEHVIDSQHVREYPRATRTGDDALKLMVKQYTPKSNPHPQPGDLTIIGAHGSGFPKELYEPIWEGVLSQLSDKGIRVRSIWIADIANQAASGVLNGEYLGNDPSWFDHARDLLYMINHFKRDMPRPIVGIGHSLGAGQLVLLSMMHPRLLTSLVLIEPVIEKDVYTGKGPIFVKLSLDKKDTWESREKAASHFKKQFKTWDPKVLERWLQYGLRSLPDSDAVTLTTSRSQEVMYYMRPNFDNRKRLSSKNDPSAMSDHDPCFHADIIGPAHAVYPFYRNEPILLWHLLRHVRPSVLYLFGDRSPVSTPDLREEKLTRTGTCIGGSGGWKNHRVKEITIPRTGHQLPFENVSRICEETAGWLKQEVVRWSEDEARILEGWLDDTPETRASVPKGWQEHLNACLSQATEMPKAQSKL
ncbi:hypothetical protein PMG11_10104 [Penicillium brasilianum]|uniref:AB hydrolase-1 domain-containing protein n=1 Tax=Penicillium brasilianum TaxID=104259 RepID=A0A0F7TY23_PENBI|nr:hypothetical protein PMG11_10104 [Penicillium brasilianum]